MPLLVIILAILLVPAVRAQSTSTENKPIQDNSFLVEEAYNQEFGVVQHISSFQRNWNTKDWLYTFTQEWPFDPSPRHQLSYTISVVSTDGFPGGGGLGDVALNYRYQLIGSGDTRVAFAPRITLLLPAGSVRFGHGAGGAGVQGNLPMSIIVSKRLVTHWNVGSTIVPAARDAQGHRSATYGYNVGQSVVWVAKPRFNVLVETIWAGSEAVVGPGQTQRNHTLLVSPGVRWSHNLSNGLQIVPGIGIPVGMGPSAGDKGLFFYLSFEHPFRSLPVRNEIPANSGR